jgi:pyridoxal phosphate enzyme (YggS family)
LLPEKWVFLIFLGFMAAYDELAKNVARMRSDIDESLAKAGRSGASVTIVAVTKRFPAAAIEAAVAVGLTDIGESRVQETAAKKPEVLAECKWHLIGHLQKNKIGKALELYDMIQSVDSYELAEAIDSRASESVEILLQVDSSGEETKFGIAPDDVLQVASDIAKLSNVRVRGLMTIGPLTEDETRIRHSFRLTKALYNELKETSEDIIYLSMGMSGDYRIAIEEGSNMIRVGTSLFGPRPE